jgi:hypothetical protein
MWAGIASTEKKIYKIQPLPKKIVTFHTRHMSQICIVIFVGMKISTATARNNHDIFGKKIHNTNLAVKNKVMWYWPLEMQDIYKV